MWEFKEIVAIGVCAFFIMIGFGGCISLMGAAEARIIKARNSITVTNYVTITNYSVALEKLK